MPQAISADVMMNTKLVKELADIAKDAALLHGVQMRIQESPNSSEVSCKNTTLNSIDDDLCINH